MPYDNRKFVNDINQSMGMSQGQLVIFKKHGSAIRADVDSTVDYKSHIFGGDDLTYRENGSTKSVTLSDIESVNGVRYSDYHTSY